MPEMRQRRTRPPSSRSPSPPAVLSSSQITSGAVYMSTRAARSGALLNSRDVRSRRRVRPLRRVGRPRTGLTPTSRRRGPARRAIGHRSGAARAGGRRRQDVRDRRRWPDHASARARPGRDHGRQGRIQAGDGLGDRCGRRVSGDSDPARAAGRARGARHGLGDAHGQAHRRSADARRGHGRRRDRGKAAHDARRHRDDAERDGRPPRAGDVAVARRRERARAGHARPLHAIPLGRIAAVWRRRRARAAADSAERSWTSGSDQGCRVRVVRRRRAGRCRRSDLAASDGRADPRGARESNQPRRHGRRVVCDAAVHGAVERHDAAGRTLAATERRRR